MEGIVDRIVGKQVVIEVDGKMNTFDKVLLDERVREGDVVDWIEGRWIKNEARTKQRVEEIKKLMDDVWAD